MCYHIVRTLLQVSLIDEVYVFCSSPEVMEHMPEGALLLQRDKALDGDLVKGKELYEAFIAAVPADTYVLAHTTSPFLKAATITHALEKMRDHGCDSAFSAKEIKTFAWYDDKPLNYSLEDVPRTQDIKPVLVETSGFYAFHCDLFTEHSRRIGFHPYLTIVDDFEGIDIDTQADYDLAIALSSLYSA